MRVEGKQEGSVNSAQGQEKSTEPDGITAIFQKGKAALLLLTHLLMCTFF